MSESRQYRGRCRYKSGRCPNERTLKYNGAQVHSLCEEHRLRHNQNQRKADSKRRKGPKSNDINKTNVQTPNTMPIQWITTKRHPTSIETTNNQADSMVLEDWELEWIDDIVPWTTEDLDLLIECVSPKHATLPLYPN